MQIMKKPFLEKKPHAVYCPDGMEYFLATEKDVAGGKLVSPFTGRTMIDPDTIPLNTKSTIQFSVAEVESFAKTHAAAIKALATDQYKLVDKPPLEVIKEFEAKRTEGLKLCAQFSNEEMTHAAEIIAFQNESSFKAAYLDAHQATYSVAEGTMCVFTVGAGASVLLSTDVMSIPDADDLQEAAIVIGAVAAILLEVLLIIGIIMDVRGRPEKTAKAIEEALSNSNLMAEILGFLQKVKDGAMSVMEFCGKVILALQKYNLLKHLLFVFLAGMGLAALGWFIVTLLLKLASPWLVMAVKGIQIAAATAGIAGKIVALGDRLLNPSE